jgi:glutamyl endopeptidase
MPTNMPSEAEHSPVSNRDQPAAPKFFSSTPPSIGENNDRHPVDAAGFESVPGFQMPPPAPPTAPQVRAASELTYREPKATPLSNGPIPLAGHQAAVIDTTLYPWRANAALSIKIPGSGDAFLGSGWFIGPYAVITAGHCVYPWEDGGYQGWAAEIEVTPGLNGINNPVPYGRAVSKAFYCPTGWMATGDPALDYGVILLNQAVGLKVGTYGFATYASSDLLSTIANLSGYPVNSPDGSNPQGRQWYSAGNVTRIESSFVYYNLDTRSGESGGCVYRNIGSQSYAMAIHTSNDGTINRGVRITTAVYKNLQQWQAMRA